MHPGFHLQVEPLPSETLFDVLCGARDTAGNVAEPPATLQVETLDITPPVFTGGTPEARSIQEDSFAFTLQLDEQGTVRPQKLVFSLARA